ncbi:hypothetical protein BRC91_09620 [Halobacteriales archaeon QS_4_62_28]|nr:MAG: hypothetical protein BRC91_09620 [Halobacteriales archaeon QS_4_62_28]
MQRSRGMALILAGLIVFSATMVVSAATAPSRDIQASDTRATSTQTSTDSTATATATEPDATATQNNSTATVTPTPTATSGTTKTLFGIQGGGQGWHKHGRVGLLVDNEVEWRVSDADSYFDVTRLENGSVVAGFMHGGYEEGCAPYESPCTKTGIRIVDPSGAGEPTVKTVYTLPVRTPVNSEIHDVEPLGNGRYLFTDMENERIAIYGNGEITWEWKASSFYEAPADPTRVDWLHINDVDIIGDGRYLVSVRNANQLLVIQRGEGVVEVINEDRNNPSEPCTQHRGIEDYDGDGDVRCGDPELFDEQHNPQWLGNGAVLVADSENDRIVEVHRTDDGAWEPVWALTEAGGREFNWPRDADRLPNGNTLITDSLNKRILEVEQNGDVVWSYGTELYPYEADPFPAGEYPDRQAGQMREPTPAESSNATETVESTESEQSPSSSGSIGTVAPEQAGNVDRNDGLIPGLSLLLAGVKAVAPWLPVWFSETQIGMTIVSLGFIASGGISLWRN